MGVQRFAIDRTGVTQASAWSNMHHSARVLVLNSRASSALRQPFAGRVHSNRISLISAPGAVPRKLQLDRRPQRTGRLRFRRCLQKGAPVSMTLVPRSSVQRPCARNPHHRHEAQTHRSLRNRRLAGPTHLTAAGYPYRRQKHPPPPKSPTRLIGGVGLSPAQPCSKRPGQRDEIDVVTGLRQRTTAL